MRAFDQHSVLFCEIDLQPVNERFKFIEFNNRRLLHASPAGRIGNHVGTFAQREQNIHYLCCAQTHHLVAAAFIGTKLEHIAQHSHFAAFQFVEQIEAASIDSGEAL